MYESWGFYSGAVQGFRSSGMRLCQRVSGYLPSARTLLPSRFSASQENPCIWWNPKVHYRTHKSSPPTPSLSEIDPVQASIPLVDPF